MDLYILSDCYDGLVVYFLDGHGYPDSFSVFILTLINTGNNWE